MKTDLVAAILVSMATVAWCSGAGSSESCFDLKPSDIDGIGSSDEATHDAAVGALVADGPLRLEELQCASRTLNQIIEMRDRLMTPHLDVRAGFGPSEAEMQESIDFFIKYHGTKWLIGALGGGDIQTIERVSAALLTLESGEKHSNRVQIVRACVPILRNHEHLGGIGSDSPLDPALINLTQLTAALIDLKPRPSATQDVHVNFLEPDTKRVADAADIWLSAQKN